jgi:nicotinate-nucleotide pyrophosphorylase (carboxylating)
MDTSMMRKAVALRNNLSPGVLLEASGGITLETLRAIADTGVDRISVGALTHSAPNADLSLELGHAA